MKLSTIISLILWLSTYSLLADQKDNYPEIKTDVFFQTLHYDTLRNRIIIPDQEVPVSKAYKSEVTGELEML